MNKKGKRLKILLRIPPGGFWFVLAYGVWTLRWAFGFSQLALGLLTDFLPNSFVKNPTESYAVRQYTPHGSAKPNAVEENQGVR